MQITAIHWFTYSSSRTPPHIYFWDCRGVTTYDQPWRSYTGCPSCTESSSSWHWWCSQSTHTAVQTTSAILRRHATVIRHGLVSARRPAAATLFHGQEQDLATEPSLWPAQLYETVSAAVCEADSLHSFRRKLKTHLFTLF